MLIAGTLLLPAGRDRVRLALGQLLVRNGRLAEVAEGRSLGTPDLGSEQVLVSPGFVDAHVHLPQFDVIGFDGLPLLEWLQTAVFPAEAKWADAAFAGQMTTRVASRLIASGTTAIAAYATVHHAAALSAIAALDASGMRAIVGQVLMDQHAPAELCRPAAQLLREAASLPGRGRVEPAVTPRFAVSCSGELLEGAGRLAKSTGWPVQTHLSETRGEVDLVADLHGGLGYLEVYDRAGLLGERSVLGHGIWLKESERARLAMTKSVVAHCPTANLFLQAGQMSRAAATAANIRIALGSDVAGGPDVCMVRVARAMLDTAKRLRLDDPRISLIEPATAWWQITSGNAAALGWSDSGSLVKGQHADLVIIDPSIGPNAEPDWRSAPDPLSKLLYAWDERWISHTVVAGRMAFSSASTTWHPRPPASA